MKKVIILFISIFIFANSLFAQDKTLIDSLLQITKTQSVYRNNMNWQAVDQKVKNAVNTKGATMFERISPAVGILLDEINDNHSFLQIGDKRIKRATKTDFLERIDENTMRAVNSTDQQKIRIFRFKNNIGYIQIPQMNPNKTANEKDLAQNLLNSLGKINSPDLKGIIVDLRLNTGGDMWPMIAGVAPLLGEGIAGYFMVEGRPVSYWKIKKGQIYQGSKIRMNLRNNVMVNKDLKNGNIDRPGDRQFGRNDRYIF